MTQTAPLLSVDATSADAVWRLTVQSSERVIGHICRVNGECAYFAGPFNGLIATFSDPSLERLEERIVATNTLGT